MTMLAARIHGHGGNEVLRLDELPIPARKPGEPRVRMVATARNMRVLPQGGGRARLKARIFGEQIDGTFAGFVCAPEASVFRKPESLDFLQAASESDSESRFSAVSSRAKRNRSRVCAS